MSETTDQDILATIHRFVEHDVIPSASEFEHKDEYPQAMVDTMKQLGLFGATIPAEYGGLGLSFTTYARIIEELSRGWMSLSGVINSHLIMGFIIANAGTAEQKSPFPARHGHRRKARRSGADRTARGQRRAVDPHGRQTRRRQLSI